MSDTLGNTVKILGETLISPGASQLIDGNIKSGGLHILGGLAAKALFGLPGFLLVAANSYTKSVTGESLYKTLVSSGAAAEVAEPAEA